MPTKNKNKTKNWDFDFVEGNESSGFIYYRIFCVSPMTPKNENKNCITLWSEAIASD